MEKFVLIEDHLNSAMENRATHLGERIKLLSRRRV